MLSDMLRIRVLMLPLPVDGSETSIPLPDLTRPDSLTLGTLLKIGVLKLDALMLDVLMLLLLLRLRAILSACGVLLVVLPPLPRVALQMLFHGLSMSAIGVASVMLSLSMSMLMMTLPLLPSMFLSTVRSGASTARRRCSCCYRCRR